MFDTQVAALQLTLAELEVAPPVEASVDEVLDPLGALESVTRRLSVFGLGLLRSLDGSDGTARLPRLRDALANALNISGADAGSRIGSAADLAGAAPTLEHTAAALRAGLIGAEAVRIIRDTVGKLPDNAPAADREFFDVELATVAVAERPEVLRREAAKMLAGYDAVRSDPVTRERARMARRGFTVGPQGADGMSHGRFCPPRPAPTWRRCSRKPPARACAIPPTPSRSPTATRIRLLPRAIPAPPPSKTTTP